MFHLVLISKKKKKCIYLSVYEGLKCFYTINRQIGREGCSDVHRGRILVM